MRPYPDPKGILQILIVGGSQGAKVFSEVIPPALQGLSPEIKARLKIAQQARAEDLPAVVAQYQNSGLDVEVHPFFVDMPERLGAAHLLVARSGASTVAEANVAGRPALYVPFPWNRDNQQKFNADVVAAVGGAKVLLEKDMTSDSFRSALLSLLENPEGLCQAAAAAKTLAQPKAAQKLADDVVSLLPS
jgi:UDP-N-acetylglucosamine--N-acetylmuramyl-(pentapeptide) pyrophosphoryl-undecaprenol N-acetylglucosamine transferase